MIDAIASPVVSESTRGDGGVRPGTVRIDDFADPQFTPDVREMLAGIEPLGEHVELTPAALMDLARAETGLSYFGPDDIADAISWAVTRPPHVNVNEILIRPTKQSR